MAKSQSKSKQSYLTNYKSTNKWKTNRLKKLERALKRSPGNKEQIQAAMANVSYRRGTPNTPTWSASKIATAKLFKKFCGKCPTAIFSSNHIASVDALMALSRNTPKVGEANGPKEAIKHADFTIGARVRYKV